MLIPPVVTLAGTSILKKMVGYNIYAADGKKSFIKLNAQTHRSHIYIDSIGTSLMNEKDIISPSSHRR